MEILVYLFIIAVLLGISRIVVASRRTATVIEEAKFKEGNETNLQNYLYGYSQGLKEATQYINSGKIAQASHILIRVKTYLPAFTHEQFSSIEWKDFLSQTQNRTDELIIFLKEHYSTDFEAAIESENAEILEQQKRRISKEKAQRKWVILIYIALILIAIPLIIAVVTKFYASTTNYQW